MYSPAHVIIELLKPNTFIIELERGNCLQNVDIYKLAYLFVRPLITFQASKLNLRCRCDTKTGGPRANREIQIYNKSRSYSALQNICQTTSALIGQKTYRLLHWNIEPIVIVSKR